MLTRREKWNITKGSVLLSMNLMVTCWCLISILCRCFSQWRALPLRLFLSRTLPLVVWEVSFPCCSCLRRLSCEISNLPWRSHPIWPQHKCSRAGRESEWAKAIVLLRIPFSLQSGESGTESCCAFACPSLGFFEGVSGTGLYVAPVKVKNFGVLKAVREHQFFLFAYKIIIK